MRQDGDKKDNIENYRHKPTNNHTLFPYYVCYSLLLLEEYLLSDLTSPDIYSRVKIQTSSLLNNNG